MEHGYGALSSELVDEDAQLTIILGIGAASLLAPCEADSRHEGGARPVLEGRAVDLSLPSDGHLFVDGERCDFS